MCLRSLTHNSKIINIQPVHGQWWFIERIIRTWNWELGNVESETVESFLSSQSGFRTWNDVDVGTGVDHYLSGNRSFSAEDKSKKKVKQTCWFTSQSVSFLRCSFGFSTDSIGTWAENPGVNMNITICVVLRQKGIFLVKNQKCAFIVQTLSPKHT